MNKDYIKGLFDMASFGLGYSYSKINFLPKEGYSEQFQYLYDIKQDISFQKIDFDLKSFAENVFQLNDEAVKTFIYFLTKQLGECSAIYTIEDGNVIDRVEKNSTFYIVDDIFFLVFPEVILSIVIGNNE